MNEETIEKRASELRRSLLQLEANCNATRGAIQECEYWLAKFESDETKVKAKIGHKK